MLLHSFSSESGQVVVMSDPRKKALKRIVKALGLHPTSATTADVILAEIEKLKSKAFAKQRKEKSDKLSALLAPYTESNPHPKCGQVAPGSVGVDPAQPSFAKYNYAGEIVSSGDPTFPPDSDFKGEVIEVYDDIVPHIDNPKFEKIEGISDRSIFTYELPFVTGFEDVKTGDKFVGKDGDAWVVFGYRRRRNTSKPLQKRNICASVRLSSFISKKPAHWSELWYYPMTWVKRHHWPYSTDGARAPV